MFIELNVVEKYSDVQAFWVLWGRRAVWNLG